MKDENRAIPAQTQVQPAGPAEPARNNPAENDGIDRRNFLSCMAWAGTGLLWTMAGGVPTSRLFAAEPGSQTARQHAGSGFSFVQISDSHIGFNKPANTDVTGTLNWRWTRSTHCRGLRICCCTLATLPTRPSPLSSILRSSLSRASRPEKRFMFPANTISPATMGQCIWNDSAKERRAGAGTALRTRVCTSLASTTASRWTLWGNSVQIN